MRAGSRFTRSPRMGNLVLGRFRELLKSASGIFQWIWFARRAPRGAVKRLWGCGLEREHVEAVVFGFFFGNALLGLALDLFRPLF